MDQRTDFPLRLLTETLIRHWSILLPRHLAEAIVGTACQNRIRPIWGPNDSRGRVSIMTIRILLADDQLAVRRGLRLRLGVEADIEIVGEAANGVEALAYATRLRPDVVVMDVTMPGMDGIEATHQLRSIVPCSSVVILSMHDDATTRSRARKAGAVAFIAKHQADTMLLTAIRDAAAAACGANGSQRGRGP